VGIATWTLVSRATGFARVAMIGAVLGPTYLGNTFQSLNLLPNLAFELLTGSLFAGLLVPSLVPSIDQSDRKSIERIAGGFLGAVVAGGLVISLLAILGGQPLLGVLGVGVDDPVVAADQQRVGSLLLLLLMPQVVLYGIAGTAGAVMQAHSRFWLPAAAPALENVGIVATMVAVAVLFGTGPSLATVTTAELLVLGLGTTAAVALHAAVLWVGALRAGTLLLPRAGWRDPDVLRLFRMLTPSLGYTGLTGLRLFAALVVANTVAGGVVAFTLALHLMKLPTAIGARPVALALLPRLSRLAGAGSLARFRDETVRGVGLACFLTVPAAIGYLVLSEPLARGLSFGEMASDHGVRLLAACLAGIALGVVGEAVFAFSTNVSYALRDARTPFISNALQTGISLAFMLLALTATADVTVLLILGMALSLGNLTGAWHLVHGVLSRLPPSSGTLAPAVLRTVCGSLLMAGPTYLVAVLLQSHVNDLMGILVASGLGAGVFVALQRMWRSPELAFFLGGLSRSRPDGGR
jgi:putative peptidoglycan lipid II flippase